MENYSRYADEYIAIDASTLEEAIKKYQFGYGKKPAAAPIVIEEKKSKVYLFSRES